MSTMALVASSDATAACSTGSAAAFRAIASYPLASTMCVCAHAVGTATASATVVNSHSSTVTANRTLWPVSRSLGQDALQVGGLTEMLGAVVDDADQSRAGGHRRIPVPVDDARQVLGGDARDEVQRHLVHGVVVPSQQIGRCLDFGHLLRTVPVAGVIARQVQPEAVHPPFVGPHLLDAGDRGQLNVLHTRAVPDQPCDAVGVRARPVAGLVFGETLGELVDVFDQPGERVTEQLPNGRIGGRHTGDPTAARTN